MGKIHSELDERLQAFIAAQRVFFVGTAPNETDGHVNCSPKGCDSFRILDPGTVAYVDFVGSGVETIAHLRQNGRIVIMFCAFEGPPKIVRLHGRGSVIEAADPAFTPLLAELYAGPSLGVRAIIRVAVSRISDSCGYGVPLFHYAGERDQLAKWAERKGSAGLEDYKRAKNSFSIDGLPGIEPDPEIRPADGTPRR